MAENKKPETPKTEQAKIITRAERIAKEKKRNEELVSVKLIKTGDKNRDSLYVAINGKNVLIKAGITVRIPRKYALVIEESIRQQELTMALIEQVADRG